MGGGSCSRASQKKPCPQSGESIRLDRWLPRPSQRSPKEGPPWCAWSRESGREITQPPEVQQRAVGCEPKRVNCEQQRSGAGRKDSCALRDNAHAGLATDQYGPGNVPLLPVHAIGYVLVGEASAPAIR